MISDGTPNTIFAGEEKLQRHARSFSRKVEQINEQVWFFTGFGGSNMIAVIGDDGCVLIDALNGKEVAEDALVELRKITDKPIKTIIYTHTHFDHTGGAGVFGDNTTEVIAHDYQTKIYGHTERLEKISKKRGVRQLGPTLSKEESICVGIGIWNRPFSASAVLSPNHLITEARTVVKRCGIEFHLIAAPGETDDQIFVWIPAFHIMCCGDNYYESWPNLYAIRGSQYRDISAWILALEKMLEYPSQVLVPGHTAVVYGEEKIREVLTNYHDAIEYILVETLKGMDQGQTPDELVETITLPTRFAELPYLQEYYGTVKWTIRAIFNGYFGWFDGNPTHLDSLPVGEYSEKMMEMMGGADKILTEIRKSLASCQFQWAAELCDILIGASVALTDAKALKAEALIGLGRMQTSANARHYYLVCAKELEQAL